MYFTRNPWSYTVVAVGRVRGLWLQWSHGVSESRGSGRENGFQGDSGLVLLRFSLFFKCLTSSRGCRAAASQSESRRLPAGLLRPDGRAHLEAYTVPASRPRRHLGEKDAGRKAPDSPSWSQRVARAENQDPEAWSPGFSPLWNQTNWDWGSLHFILFLFILLRYIY